MFSLKQYDFKRYNYTLIAVVLLLCAVGAFVISLVQTPEENLFVKQLIGIVAGFTIAVVTSLIDYHFVCKFYIVLYIINIGLLAAVHLFGVTVNESQRWIRLGPILFQPSELSKVILILFLAKFFTLIKDKVNTWWGILSSAILAAIPTILIMEQPDLSSSMVSVFIFVVLIYAAGLSYKIILPILLVGIPSAFVLFWYVQQDFQVLLNNYQRDRILSILNPEEYGTLMYQQNNSMTAISAGGLYGKLLNDGAASFRAYDSVPISESDFIFSVIGEEFGFIGCCVFFGLFALLIFKCISVAKNAQDKLGMMIAGGISALFMFQVFVNIGVATAFLPNTGLPLPFISSGLSSLLGSFIAIGLLLNISINRKKVRG